MGGPGGRPSKSLFIVTGLGLEYFWKDSESEFSEGYVLKIALELLGSNVSAENGKPVVA
jgi:hypothetical protein